MRIIIKTLIAGTLIYASSCNNNSRQDQKKAKLELKNENHGIKSEDISYDTKPEDVLKDFMTWYNYTYINIRLAQDFIALDTDSTVLNKTQFLNKLLTGKFFAIKTVLKNNIPTYKLFSLNNKDSDIVTTNKQLASNEISNYKMEGKELPDFNFTDLNGVVYNKAATNGKILILKCWFIHCVTCVKEFPELNQLVKDYRKDKNVIFLSLASDNKNDLIDFLKKKQFNYAVIPNSDMYMKQSLGVQSYPTHLFVDENGKIQKVVNNVDDLIAFMRKSKL